ncbi:MAG: discoidin domain-containing protein [Candidatus Thiodiazotropha sp.]
MIMLLFSGGLASEPRTKYFSKGLKVFSELIATDLEEDDFLEIMNYIGSRFHWHYCDERIQTLLEATTQHEKEIQTLSANLTDYKKRYEEAMKKLMNITDQLGTEIQRLTIELYEDKQQLRSEISETKIDLSEKIANDSKVSNDDIQKAMAEQNNQLKQAFCDLKSIKSCLSGDCCFEQTFKWKNVALGKTAWQSSDYYSDHGQASAAVDGNRNISLLVGKSCFHTQKESHAWWIVDLGVEKHIGRVLMVNRGDGSYSRLRNVVVSVSLEKDGDGVICGTFEGPGGKGQVITIRCPEEIRGRFVKLTMNSNNYFHLCEVEVYRQ